MRDTSCLRTAGIVITTITVALAAGPAGAQQGRDPGGQAEAPPPDTVRYVEVVEGRTVGSWLTWREGPRTRGYEDRRFDHFPRTEHLEIDASGLPFRLEATGRIAEGVPWYERFERGRDTARWFTPRTGGAASVDGPAFYETVYPAIDVGVLARAAPSIRRWACSRARTRHPSTSPTRWGPAVSHCALLSAQALFSGLLSPSPLAREAREEGLANLMALLPALHAAGVPAPEVLALSTLGASREMGRADDLGTIEPGKLADLILVDGDPTVYIRDIRRVTTVVKDGTVYDPAAICRALEIEPCCQE